MNTVIFPVGFRASAMASVTLGACFMLLGGCEYICCDCAESSTEATTESAPAPVETNTAKAESDYSFMMGADPDLDGDADMMLVQIAPTDASQSSR